ncbi:hypothetical protein E2C01_082872 [Portunus trituberculatus]|uniref:Uncharacterized protein n=1 Tax=Portunus trituberculatus TaxID=210409 RepID=A0A5B7J689_PORTR|nr:hypothetical protein [Portunus trituberculatus]
MKGVTSERALPSVPLLAHWNETSKSRQTLPRESLARAAKEGLRTGAEEGLTAVEVEGRGPHSTKGVPGAGRGWARALSVASWSILSALDFEDCSAS